MLGIGLEQREVLVGQLAHLEWKMAVQFPELRRGDVLHSGRV